MIFVFNIQICLHITYLLAVILCIYNFIIGTNLIGINIQK